MGTMVLRSQDCLQNPLPAEALRTSPPEKSCREAARLSHTGRTLRQTKLPPKSAAFPSSRSPPSQTRPFPRRNNRRGCAAPLRPGRRCRTPEHHCRMVARQPVKELVSDHHCRMVARQPVMELVADRRRMVVRQPVKELVMEEVTILRRGQEGGAGDPAPVDREGNAVATAAGGDDLELCSTGRLGPDPETLPKQIRLMDQKPHHYTGSGFFTSPPPSSLPLPTSFLVKKDVAADAADLATRDLRCLLRLDLP